jgi:DNA-directed RNA polymerase specialized sigma24 family protein
VQQQASRRIDPLLEPLLPLADDAAAAAFLSELIARDIEPVVERLIGYKLHLATRRDAESTDTDDLRQEVAVQLLAELQLFRGRPEQHPIADVRGLAAVIAYRACSRWLRRRFPERQAFKNRLHYLLTRQNGLGLWQNEAGKLVAGFAAWRGRSDTAPERVVEALRDEPALSERIRALAGSGSRDSSGALAAVLEHLGAPVDFDRLAGFFAGLVPIRAAALGEDEVALTQVAAGAPDPAWQAERRIFLQRLWEELQRLPVLQRAVLLLNLRAPDGRGCIELLPATGIAGLRQVAKALAMSAERLAELWNDLPLEDARVAELVAVTRQQVIDARRTARERLSRELKGFL